MKYIEGHIIYKILHKQYANETLNKPTSDKCIAGIDQYQEVGNAIAGRSPPCLNRMMEIHVDTDPWMGIESGILSNSSAMLFELINLLVQRVLISNFWSNGCG